MSVSSTKIGNDRLRIQVNGFEELKRRIKQRGYVRKIYLGRGKKLVESIQKATHEIEREFGDMVTSIYVVGKAACGQVSDDFIDLVIIMKQVFSNFMFTTHGVFVDKVFEPMLLEDEDTPFIYDPLYFTVEDIRYPLPSKRMKKVIEEVQQNGILIYGVDVLS
ncbi:hypothetical protein H8E77_44060 [bacterium]|nr:hypothetical protein [bacterium]